MNKNEKMCIFYIGKSKETSFAITTDKKHASLYNMITSSSNCSLKRSILLAAVTILKRRRERND